ncbi:hypothetical protein Pan153_19890 [Gimesia panareensis]|uniref:Uncharacterized protein n=1 Tax=Gimesia panareensis TaxID=2527978 RepID=A0A518FLY0_9PLAN|nr:hypothetical protein [Gimesia panareensis]QDV17353.1 hypothetical protein Pan153_19890 [Gimesia panareensis]
MQDENLNEMPALEINPGYALGQIAKALTTWEEHPDPDISRRAREKVAKWVQAYQGLVSGEIEVGSRTPLANTPAWVTLEVVTGGFATGNYSAGGAISDHERQLQQKFSLPQGDDLRQALNLFCLTEQGLAWLSDLLSSGCYRVEVPEEGALLVVAWLLEQGKAAQTRELLDVITPFFGKLRFFPIPAAQPLSSSSRVSLQTVQETRQNLQLVRPNECILAQREALTVWTPLYDQTVSLFLETVDGEAPFLNQEGKVAGGYPFESLPEGWTERAHRILDEYAALRKVHRLCGKPDRKKENFPQLRSFLEQFLADAGSLSERDRARVRSLLARYVNRRGTPESTRCREIRDRQEHQAQTVHYYDLTRLLLERLKQYPQENGLEDLIEVVQQASAEESQEYGIPAETEVPDCLLRKLERCRIDTIEVLVRSGVVTSGETLAKVLPQITAQLRAMGIRDPSLKQLYSAVYQSFSRRRSLLLLNLEHQVRLEELPWVTAMNQFRDENLSDQEIARETLQEVCTLTLLSFPQTIIPNKLLQEIRSLARAAKVDLKLVDEIAADIFMGVFTSKYLEAARVSAKLLLGTLYQTYYGLDYQALLDLPATVVSRGRDQTLIQLCESRAGVKAGSWSVALNGMLIEQQQIITTQNLAVLFESLNLAETLRPHLSEMARCCLLWIGSQLHVNSPSRHAALIVCKNSAYAWRQMIFYLSFLPEEELQEFRVWADSWWEQQSDSIRGRFQPAMAGLKLALDGKPPGTDPEARLFLGWSNAGHWFLPAQW